jgi:hypothetical protein
VNLIFWGKQDIIASLLFVPFVRWSLCVFPTFSLSSFPLYLLVLEKGRKWGFLFLSFFFLSFFLSFFLCAEQQSKGKPSHRLVVADEGATVAVSAIGRVGWLRQAEAGDAPTHLTSTLFQSHAVGLATGSLRIRLPHLFNL